MTEDRIITCIWWPYMRTTIANYLQQCETCQQTKSCKSQRDSYSLFYLCCQFTMDLMALPTPDPGFNSSYVVVDFGRRPPECDTSSLPGK